jgi:hypothetical protein
VATALGCNYNFFGIYGATRADGGLTYYGGTLVLDIPGKDPGPPAKGKYCVELNHDETFLFDVVSPPNDIPTAQENGFCVEIQQGSCCFGLGTPAQGCEDAVLQNECPGAHPGPSVWTRDKLCAAGCVQCLIPRDPLCNDGDACTDDDCNTAVGLCTHVPKAGFNPNKDPGTGAVGTNCCDPVTGNLTDKDDGDLCTADSCSIPAGNRGVAVHDPAGALGVSCDDGNPCTTADQCDGVNGELDTPSGCNGTDINTIDCATDADCPAGFLCGIRTPLKCDCNPVPKLTYVLDSAPKTCVGGRNDGLPCAKDSDCPAGPTGPGYCDLYAAGANCFDKGAKVTAVVNIGPGGSPINGGELLMTFDPNCLKYQSATCLAPYVTTVYGPIVNSSAGTIFIACGVDPFAGVNGPSGNINIAVVTFTVVGDCSNPATPHPCFLDFANNNPLHTTLVDDDGQPVNVEAQPKGLNVKGDLDLDVPDSVKTNVDCDKPTAAITWDAPSASFSCGTANLTCRGAHENGANLNHLVMGGGVFPQGASSFCCGAAAKDKCDQTVGCGSGPAANCAIGTNGKQVGCWTVQVNDEVSMDIDVGLEPPITSGNRDGTLTRCIEFCMYANCLEDPICFEDFITFGGIYNFNGKSQGKIKAPKGQWDCITAQDQLHSLRSCCDSQSGCLHCDGSQLVADFTGDPELGGNWLIGGNLDAFKKDVPKASHNIIDIYDWGTFAAQYGVCYANKSPGCHDGPHADINGDGCVTISDYQFILRNFLASSKDCCCVGSAAVGATPVTEVTVDQLRQMGMGDLAVADLNGDGVLNAQDMEAFAQGARPSKTSNDRKGGKGLRSGR